MLRSLIKPTYISLLRNILSHRRLLSVVIISLFNLYLLSLI